MDLSGPVNVPPIRQVPQATARMTDAAQKVLALQEALQGFQGRAWIFFRYEVS